MMRAGFLTLAIALGGSSAMAGTVLYLEDFSTGDGLGAIFGSGATNGVSVNTGTATWSLNMGDAVFDDSQDYAKVVNGMFEIVDTDAGCASFDCDAYNNSGPDSYGPDLATSGITFPTWSTPTIDISGHLNVAYSLDWSTALVNDQAFEFDFGGVGVQDLFRYEVIVDGGVFTSGVLTEEKDPDFGTLIGTVGSGSTLAIAIIGNTYQSGEFLRFDNVMVTTSIPLPAGAALLLSGFVGLGLLRRRLA